MVEETGCDGIMVARGAKGNPWIFREIAEYLETGRKPPRPSADELKAMILRHGQMMLEFKGETAGMREMRKHVAWYTAGYPNSAALRNDINTVSTMDENKKERPGKAAGRSGTAKAAGAGCGLFAAAGPEASEFNGAVVHAIEDQLEGGFF